MTESRTFPRLLRELAQEFGDRRVALQEKRYGIWQPLTWGAYYRRVRSFGQGLAALGLERGDALAILGDNRPEWVIAELAVQSFGGRSLGLYPDGVVGEVGALLESSGARVVVAEDQEQVDKVVELANRGRASSVEMIIYYDPHGLERYELDNLIEFTEVETRGDEFETSHPGWFDEQLDAGEESDVAVLCSTSGTTGRPRLAMLTHRNLLSMGSNLMAVDPISGDDEYVSFLPLAWIGEQMIALACGLQAGFALSFPEDAATVRADMREIGPRVVFSPPRIWESLVSSVQVRVQDAGWLKRFVSAWGYGIGSAAADLRLRGARLSLVNRVLYRVADWVALRPVREQLGLSRLRRAYTGGAPLGPDVFKFFHTIGVNLKQIYGQTEICGIAVLHRDDDIKFNTVGQPIPGTDIRIADDGEILLKSEAVFSGYYSVDDDAASAPADGWLATGDAGYLDDDGHLVVIDRAKDVMKTDDGTSFSPAFVENKLKFSPFIEEAVVFGGDGRPFVTSMVSINIENVGTWAERNHLTYTTYTDLAQKPQVYDLIAEHVVRANEDLLESTRIRRFVLLHKQLDADDDELTRTRKVRRRLVNDRYADIVSALYSTNDDVTVKSIITYQDGSSAEREISLRIMSMDAFTPPAPDRRRQLVWSGS